MPPMGTAGSGGTLGAPAPAAASSSVGLTLDNDVEIDPLEVLPAERLRQLVDRAYRDAQQLPFLEYRLHVYTQRLLEPLRHIVPYKPSSANDRSEGSTVSPVKDACDETRAYRKSAEDRASDCLQEASGVVQQKKSAFIGRHTEIYTDVGRLKLTAKNAAEARKVADDHLIPANQAVIAVYQQTIVKARYPGCSPREIVGLVLDNERRSWLELLQLILETLALDPQQYGPSGADRVLAQFAQRLVENDLFYNLLRLMLALDDVLGEAYRKTGAPPGKGSRALARVDIAGISIPATNFPLVLQIQNERKIVADCILFLCSHNLAFAVDYLELFPVLKSAIQSIPDEAQGTHQRTLGDAATSRTSGSQVASILLLATLAATDGLGAPGQRISSSVLDDAQYLQRIVSRAQDELYHKKDDIFKDSGSKDTATAFYSVLELGWMAAQRKVVSDAELVEFERRRDTLFEKSDPFRFLANGLCAELAGSSPESGFVGLHPKYSGIVHSLVKRCFKHEKISNLFGKLDDKSPGAKLDDKILGLLQLMSHMYGSDPQAIDYFVCPSCQGCRCCRPHLSHDCDVCTDGIFSISSGSHKPPGTDRAMLRSQSARGLSSSSATKPTTAAAAKSVTTRSDIRVFLFDVAQALHSKQRSLTPDSLEDFREQCGAFCDALGALGASSNECAKHVYQFLLDRERSHDLFSWYRFFSDIQVMCKKLNPVLIAEEKRRLETELLQVQDRIHYNDYETTQVRTQWDVQERDLQEQLRNLQQSSELDDGDALLLEKRADLMTAALGNFIEAPGDLPQHLLQKSREMRDDSFEFSAHPIELLLTLAACPVPERLRQSLLVCVADQINELSSYELVPRVLAHLVTAEYLPIDKPLLSKEKPTAKPLNAKGFLQAAVNVKVEKVQQYYPLKLAKGGMCAQMEDVEAPTGSYATTLAFLNLLSALITFGDDWVLSSRADMVAYATLLEEGDENDQHLGAAVQTVAQAYGPHAPFSRYLLYILDVVFGPLHTRKYTFLSEYWQVASSCLSILNRILQRFTKDQFESDFRQLLTTTDSEARSGSSKSLGSSRRVDPSVASRHSLGFQLLVDLLGGSATRRGIPGTNSTSFLNGLMWLCNSGRESAARSRGVQPEVVAAVELSLSVIYNALLNDDVFVERIRASSFPYVLRPLQVLLPQFDEKSMIVLAEFVNWPHFGVAASSSRIVSLLASRPGSGLGVFLGSDIKQLDAVRFAIQQLLENVEDGDAYSTAEMWQVERTRRALLEELDDKTTFVSHEADLVQDSGVAEDSLVADTFHRCVRFLGRAPEQDSNSRLPSRARPGLEVAWAPEQSHRRLSARMALVRSLIADARRPAANNVGLLLLDINGLTGGSGGLVFRALLKILGDAQVDLFPNLAAACYELIYTLATNSHTSEKVLSYLRSVDDNWIFAQLLRVSDKIEQYGPAPSFVSGDGFVDPRSAEFGLTAAALMQNAYLMKLAALELTSLHSQDQLDRYVTLLFDPLPDDDDLGAERSRTVFSTLLASTEFRAPERTLPTMHRFAAGVLYRETDDDAETERDNPIEEHLGSLGLVGKSVKNLLTAADYEEVVIDKQTQFANMDSLLQILLNRNRLLESGYGEDALHSQALFAACRAHNARTALRVSLVCVVSAWRTMLDAILSGRNFSYLLKSPHRTSRLWRLLNHLLENRVFIADQVDSRLDEAGPQFEFIEQIPEAAGAALSITSRFWHHSSSRERRPLTAGGTDPGLGELIHAAHAVAFDGIMKNEEARFRFGRLHETETGPSSLSVKLSAAATRGALYATLTNILYLMPLSSHVAKDDQDVQEAKDAAASLIRQGGEAFVRVVALDATSDQADEAWQASALSLLTVMLPLDESGIVIRSLAAGGFLTSVLDSLRDLSRPLVGGSDRIDAISAAAAKMTADKSTAFSLFRNQISLLNALANCRQGGVIGARVLLEHDFGDALATCFAVVDEVGSMRFEAAGDALLALSRRTDRQEHRLSASERSKAVKTFHKALELLLELVCSLHTAAPTDVQIHSAVVDSVLRSWDLFAQILKDKTPIVSLKSLHVLELTTSVISCLARTAHLSAAGWSSPELSARLGKLRAWFVRLLAKYGGSNNSTEEWQSRVRPGTDEQRRAARTLFGSTSASDSVVTPSTWTNDEDWMNRPCLFRHQVDRAVSGVVRNILLFMRVVVNDVLLFAPVITQGGVPLTSRQRAQGVSGQAHGLDVLVQQIKRRSESYQKTLAAIAATEMRQADEGRDQTARGIRALQAARKRLRDDIPNDRDAELPSLPLPRQRDELVKDALSSWQILELLVYLLFKHLRSYLDDIDERARPCEWQDGCSNDATRACSLRMCNEHCSCSAHVAGSVSKMLAELQHNAARVLGVQRAPAGYARDNRELALITGPPSSRQHPDLLTSIEELAPPTPSEDPRFLRIIVQELKDLLLEESHDEYYLRKKT